MGGGASKPGSDISPRTVEIMKKCGEDVNTELRRTMERLKGMKAEYQSHGTMFGVKESPEAFALRDAFARRILLGNVGGAGACYMLASLWGGSSDSPGPWARVFLPLP
ncbi:hypothetical protein VYU27_010162 [Nannochloropsis oceanica]